MLYMDRREVQSLEGAPSQDGLRPRDGGRGQRGHYKEEGANQMRYDRERDTLDDFRSTKGANGTHASSRQRHDGNGRTDRKDGEIIGGISSYRSSGDGRDGSGITPYRGSRFSSRYEEEDARDNFKSRTRDNDSRESRLRRYNGKGREQERGGFTRRERYSRNGWDRSRDQDRHFSNTQPSVSEYGHRVRPLFDKRSRARDGEVDSVITDVGSRKRSYRHIDSDYDGDIWSQSGKISAKEHTDGAIPINERPRMRPSLWDIPPRGYDSVTTEMAKISGYFTLASLPENARSYMRDPIAEVPPASALLGDIASLLPSFSRVAKRIIITGYDAEATTQSYIVDCLHRAISTLVPSKFRENTSFSTSVDFKQSEAFKAAYFALRKDHFVAEFSAPEYASALVALNQIALDPNEPELSTFTIRRPDDYVGPHCEREKAYVDEPSPPTIPDSPNKCAVTELSPGLDDNDVCELLSTFGKLKDFYHIKPYGVAIFEYNDPEATDVAIQSLTGQVISDKELKLFRLCQGLNEDPEIPSGKISKLAFYANRGDHYPETRVMQVFNGITVEDAQNDDERLDIIKQFEQECDRYGKVLEVQVPIDKANLRVGGKIYVKFESPKDCTIAVQRLAGRSFSGKTLITAFGSEHSFDLGIL